MLLSSRRTGMSGALAELHQDLRALVGQTIADRYRVDSLLGVGGMAAVFRAHHCGLKRDVAIKVLHPNLTVNREISARFDREAESASRLDHPNTIQVTDYGSTSAGMKFMVMQLLEGRELGELLVRPLPPLRAVELILQVFRGLEHAHRQGVVHRDIKPENVFITTDHDGREAVKLVDFGISKIIEGPQSNTHHTSVGLVFGTPAYMSPEQAAGMEADGRADLYAAGIILYQMLSGRLPFDSEDPVALIRMQVGRDADPLPQSVPPVLAGVVQRLLAKDRERRFQSASEVIETLEGLIPLLDGQLAPVEVMSGTSRYSPVPHSASASYPAGPQPFPSGSYGATSGPIPVGTGPFAVPGGSAPTYPGVRAAWQKRWPLWLGGGVAVLGLLVTMGVWLGHEPKPAREDGGRARGEARAPHGSQPLENATLADPAAIDQVDRLILTKEFDKAEELLKPLRDANPDDPRLLWRQGRILAASKRKQAQALAAYGQALSVDPQLLEDRDFYAETYELLRTKKLRDEALDLALQKMGLHGHTFLLELVNDTRSPLEYHDRRRALEELDKVPESAGLINRQLNIALDLLQASKSMIPCRAYLAALNGIAAAPDYYFFARVEKAKVPAEPGPGISGSLAEEPEACHALAQRREEVLTMLAALSPEAEAALQAEAAATLEEGPVEVAEEVIEIEEEPAEAPAAAATKKKRGVDCNKVGAVFKKKCRQ